MCIYVCVHVHMCVCVYKYMNFPVVADTLTFPTYLQENVYFHISCSPIHYKSNITDIIKQQSFKCFKTKWLEC